MNRQGNLFVGIIFIVLGISFLFDINVFRYIWPLFLIFIGFRILNRSESMECMGEAEESQGDKMNVEAIFRGINRRVISDDFKGGKISLVFGGGELDLREAKIVKEARLKIDAVFGGMKVIVPEGWKVEVYENGVMGGFANNTRSNKECKAKLIIEAASVFGGGEVTN